MHCSSYVKCGNSGQIMIRMNNPFSLFLLLLVRGVSSFTETCMNTADCIVSIGPGSECRNGNCSNPFEKGCLETKLPGWAKIRVCNSDDPADAAEQGLCRMSEFNYVEIRPYPQNWESPVFATWIIQIILSEILDVPTTVESGLAEAKLNFYDPDNSYDFGTSSDYNCLIRGAELSDCRLACRSPENYEPCAHVVPELWDALTWATDWVKNGTLEPPEGDGLMGYQSWYVPKFTAEREPRVMSYLGLQGEEMRHRLAELFLRPTTWQDYCELISLDNCTTADGVAARAPRNLIENQRMFVSGLYTGHFRATEENNCTLHPTTCTGHIADYPCGWTSYVQPLTHWLNIALESSGDQPGCHGYTYEQLLDMWDAANATKSNLMMQWWQPEAHFQSYLSTDAEFMSILLPPTTQECVDNQVPMTDRCSNDTSVRLGDPKGACGQSGTILGKLIIADVYNFSYGASVPEGLRSPAYEVLQQYSLTEVQLGDLFNYYFQASSPREAVCQWLADNIQFVDDLIPRTYPRILEERSDTGPLLYVSVIFGCVAALAVLWTGWMVYRKRSANVIKDAQVEFLALLLVGSFTITLGAIVAAAPPTNASCQLLAWFINIGYTLELVPLIVKVAAINHLMSAAKRLRRVTLRRSSLFGAVLLISIFVIVFLIFWTVLDPLRRTAEYTLASTEAPDGSTAVYLQFYCNSESDIWNYLSVGWNGLLLLIATILAFQSRNVRQDFNESQTLAIMIYSHFVFLIMRVITYALSSSLNGKLLGRARSLLYSVDQMSTVCIYFLPKFMKVHDQNSENTSAWLTRLGSRLNLSTASSQNGSEIALTRHGSSHISGPPGVNGKRTTNGSCSDLRRPAGAVTNVSGCDNSDAESDIVYQVEVTESALRRVSFALSIEEVKSILLGDTGDLDSFEEAGVGRGDGKDQEEEETVEFEKASNGNQERGSFFDNFFIHGERFEI